MKPLVLSLCDRTGNAVRPWAAARYECWTVDTRHPPGVGPDDGGVRKVGCDVLRFVPPLGRRVVFVFAFPPCTDLAVSGARWFAGKGLDALADAIRVVAACSRICEASGAPYLIENPISTLATYWRKPDHKFDPCDYAGYADDPAFEAYTKKTCLWTGGGFRMPPPRPVPPTLGSKMHVLSPSDDRADLRSVTPTGFARAVFEANHQTIPESDVKLYSPAWLTEMLPLHDRLRTASIDARLGRLTADQFADLIDEIIPNVEDKDDVELKVEEARAGMEAAIDDEKTVRDELDAADARLTELTEELADTEAHLHDLIIFTTAVISTIRRAKHPLSVRLGNPDLDDVDEIREATRKLS